jgi:hypothetical protein
MEHPSGLLLRGSTRVIYKLLSLVSPNVVGSMDDKEFIFNLPRA